eukprot:808191-Rhodomonas_salina.1
MARKEEWLAEIRQEVSEWSQVQLYPDSSARSTNLLQKRKLCSRCVPRHAGVPACDLVVHAFTHVRSCTRHRSVVLA